jgi:hypothetical protein
VTCYIDKEEVVDRITTVVKSKDRNEINRIVQSAIDEKNLQMIQTGKQLSESEIETTTRIGPTTKQRLYDAGIHTADDLLNADALTLQKAVDNGVSKTTTNNMISKLDTMTEQRTTSIVSNIIKNNYKEMGELKSLLATDKAAVTKMLIREIGKTLTVLGAPTIGITIDKSKGFAYSPGMNWNIYVGKEEKDRTVSWLPATQIESHAVIETNKINTLIANHLTSKYTYIKGQYQCVQFANEFVQKAHALGFNDVYIAAGMGKPGVGNHAFVAIMGGKNIDLVDITAANVATGPTLDQDKIVLLEPQEDIPLEYNTNGLPRPDQFEYIAIFKNYVMNTRGDWIMAPSADDVIVLTSESKPPDIADLIKLPGEEVVTPAQEPTGESTGAPPSYSLVPQELPMLPAKTQISTEATIQQKMEGMPTPIITQKPAVPTTYVGV